MCPSYTDHPDPHRRGNGGVEPLPCFCRYPITRQGHFVVGTANRHESCRYRGPETCGYRLGKRYDQHRAVQNRQGVPNSTDRRGGECALLLHSPTATENREPASILETQGAVQAVKRPCCVLRGGTLDLPPSGHQAGAREKRHTCNAAFARLSNA